MRALSGFSLAVFAIGCSIQTGGTGTTVGLVDAPAAVDTGIAREDVTIDDTHVDDSGSPETMATADADADTATVDSATPDALPDVPADAPGPSVTIATSAPLGGMIDLTALGAVEWAHWGHTKADDFHRKKLGSRILEGVHTGGVAYDSGYYRFKWTDGDPTAEVDTARGIQFDKVDENIVFEVKGSPTPESVVDLYFSANGAANVSGTLSDATTASATTTLGIGVHQVRFRFRTATAAGSLKITVKKTDGVGYVGFFAAVLK